MDPQLLHERIEDLEKKRQIKQHLANTLANEQQKYKCVRYRQIMNDMTVLLNKTHTAPYVARLFIELPPDASKCSDLPLQDQYGPFRSIIVKSP